MNAAMEAGAPSDPALAAALFAIDPSGVGGIAVRARAGPIRDRWFEQLGHLLPAEAPVRRVPLHVADGRLLGGLDLAATLRAGRPVAERGMVAQTDGGVLILAMAERIPAATVARLSAALDEREVVLERDGLAGRLPARIGVVAFDEGIDDERPHPALMERLAFHIGFDGLDTIVPAVDRKAIDAARALLPAVAVEPATLAALCEAALVLGIASMRADVFALRVAKASAALAGRSRVEEADTVLAARLVLAPRATRLPATEQSSRAPPPAPDPSEGGSPPPPADAGEGADTASDPALGELVVAAACAAIPAGLLAQLQAAAQTRSSSAPAGRVGALRQSVKRGRPAGFRRGQPGGGLRLNVIETLRAAAPWQRLRGRTIDPTQPHERSARVAIRPDDFRVTRFKQRSETTTIFVVDASGSLALNRLAEAKGAVELLLADCYVRRDQVALLAFRGKGVELLLAPTRSLVRAKRSLAGLPGGGATPLASAIDAAVALGDQLRRRGQTPVIVFLTDGRANVARDGTAGRGRADEDALAAARAARATGIRTLVVDAAQRAQPPARNLAREMGALYLALPQADASALSNAVRASAPARG